MVKKGLLERLREGPVVGDGSYVFTLEKRTYVKAGPWTPEVVVEHPDAVKQLHKEYIRAGADVVQAFTFYSTDDKLNLPGHEAGGTITVISD
ncbi:betaine--homocysteine S-methyltransferase 1-like [Branchiostoma lanceolatum]|uniref:betaine--homocysteine S-methyltransferase 1-like n=1 Tax=Branchiostoma lanceolatum TaxID=7740 RepID=UPI0034566595